MAHIIYFSAQKFVRKVKASASSCDQQAPMSSDTLHTAMLEVRNGMATATEGLERIQKYLAGH